MEQLYGATESLRYSETGGLSQFGAYLQTLQPGARSSERHWHEEADEFLYMLSGEATVIEEDGAHLLHPGDAACWPAGAANASLSEPMLFARDCVNLGQVWKSI